MTPSLKVALDTHLNPTARGTDYMKHLQYANHYRDLLRTIKKAGYLNVETIPLKEQYTTCLKSPVQTDGQDWELRVLAGSMTLTTTADGKLMLTQMNMVLEDYITALGINRNSPTAMLVRGKLNLMKELTKVIGVKMATDCKRIKIRAQSKECLSNITNNLKEKHYV